MTTTAIAVIETPHIEAESKAITLLDQAKALLIVTNEDREQAEQIMKDLDAMGKAVFAYLDPPRAKAWEDYQYHKKRLDEAYNPIVNGKKEFKQTCIAWDDEQERLRKEAEQQAQEEARKREEEAQLAAALEAEQSGDKETAEAILAEPVQVAPVIMPRTAPAPSRLSAGRTFWYATVTNVKELCKAIGAGTASTEFVIGLDKDKKTGIISSPALNKLAAAMKNTMNVPGVQAKSKTV